MEKQRIINEITIVIQEKSEQCLGLRPCKSQIIEGLTFSKLRVHLNEDAPPWLKRMYRKALGIPETRLTDEFIIK